MKDSETSRVKSVRWKIGVGLLLSLLWGNLAVAQSRQPPWSWEVLGSYIPKFEERDEDCKPMLVVEVLFRNNQPVEQDLVMAKEQFQVTTVEGKPVKVLGPLFRSRQLEGAKKIEPVSGRPRMETLTEAQGGATQIMMRALSAIRVTVGGGQSYKQRILLIKPEPESPLRLTFSGLPELEFPLPK